MGFWFFSIFKFSTEYANSGKIDMETYWFLTDENLLMLSRWKLINA